MNWEIMTTTLNNVLHSAVARKSVRVVDYVNQRVTNPLGAQATGLCACSEIRHLSAVTDRAELALLLN